MKVIDLLAKLSEAVAEHGTNVRAQIRIDNIYYEVTEVGVSEVTAEGEVRAICID